MISIKNTTIFLSILLLAVVISACTQSSNTTGTTTIPDNSLGPTGTLQNTTTGRTKLADSQYANFAYLISGDTLDSSAKAATSGFTITKTPNSDGTTTISLTSTNPEYQDQTYTLQPGEKLYFIERNMGDDSGGQEGFLGDDTAIIVDAQGYIVQR